MTEPTARRKGRPAVAARRPVRGTRHNPIVTGATMAEAEVGAPKPKRVAIRAVPTFGEIADEVVDDVDVVDEVDVEVDIADANRFEDGPDETASPDATTSGEPSEEAPAAGAAQQPPPEPAGTPSKAPICSVVFCPICTVVTALGDARPEVAQHVLLASREVLLAIRAVIDARLDGTDPPSKGPKMEHISIE